ncbi:hypothetical protein N9L68_08040, partial [bacterium]|nr:hypothetical protein [bacterium]
EEVLCVQDDNRPGCPRIDFLCDVRSGEVKRNRLGRSDKDSMKPHHMPLGCNSFDAAEARPIGVGAALHQRPLGLVASSGVVQPGELLCTRQGMDTFCRYDINMVNSKQARDNIAELGNDYQEVDGNDCQHFPWRLWLANTGKLRYVANYGISGVRLSVINGSKCVVVDYVWSTYHLSPDPVYGNIIVHPLQGCTDDRNGHLTFANCVHRLRVSVQMLLSFA